LVFHCSLFFFFSSRRRHTRSLRDWSSDVCSSDLEISYIHAEGYPAGEMKHGPIALIDDQMPVVVLLPKDPVYTKTLSNMKEVERSEERRVGKECRSRWSEDH